LLLFFAQQFNRGVKKTEYPKNIGVKKTEAKKIPVAKKPWDFLKL
jgi:hypothetical protein